MSNVCSFFVTCMKKEYHLFVSKSPLDDPGHVIFASAGRHLTVPGLLLKVLFERLHLCIPMGSQIDRGAVPKSKVHYECGRFFGKRKRHSPFSLFFVVLINKSPFCQQFIIPLKG